MRLSRKPSIPLKRRKRRVYKKNSMIRSTCSIIALNEIGPVAGLVEAISEVIDLLEESELQASLALNPLEQSTPLAQ